MRIFYRIILIVSTLFVGLVMSASSYSEDHESCYTNKVKWYLAYKSELNSPDGNTAKYFNLKYLVQEMENIGVPKKEITNRLLSYLSNIDERQSQLTIISANAICEKNIARVVFSISDAAIINNSNSEYLVVRFLDGKIINISFQRELDRIEDGIIKNLDFTLIPQLN